MPRNPFGSFDDDFETNPVVRATGSVVKQIAKGAAQQVTKAAKTASSQVRGTGTSSSQSTTAAGSQQQKIEEEEAAAISKTDPIAQARRSLSTPVYFHPTMQKGGKSKQVAGSVPLAGRTPDEQEELDKLRKMLYQHKQDYYDATLGRLSDLDQDVRKKRREREEEEKRRKQEEEEEEKKKKEEEAKKRKQLIMPQGKNSRARMGMPFAVKKAQTKTETGKLTG